MAIPTYTPGYPPDGSSLGQTKVVIRNNLDGTFQTLGVDHINNNGAPGAQPAGYHSVIHMVPQGSNPPRVNGYGQLFSKVVNSFTSDAALFWETGGGLIQQLTVNLTPVLATNGYTFLPGGLIYQWGVLSSPAQAGFITFPVPFPNNCFNVQLTIRRDSSTGTQAVYLNGSPATNRFGYTGSSSSNTALFWTAIGN
jgi:hypothetical protein